MKQFFNYKTENKTPKHLTKTYKQNQANNRFLDETFNFNLFWDAKDGGSGIDKALKAKHNIKGAYQSKEATKRARFQSML